MSVTTHPVHPSGSVFAGRLNAAVYPSGATIPLPASWMPNVPACPRSRVSCPVKSPGAVGEKVTGISTDAPGAMVAAGSVAENGAAGAVIEMSSGCTPEFVTVILPWAVLPASVTGKASSDALTDASYCACSPYVNVVLGRKLLP